jgi:hypothetical protein
VFRLALWLLQQYHLTLNAGDVPVYVLPRRDMTTALPPAPEWNQGEQYTTILRTISGEPRVESGYVPGPEDVAALANTQAPHEVSGVLRMFQTGTNGPEIARKLGKSGRQVQYEMTLGLEDQEDAGLRGQAMYNDRIQVCSCGEAMHTGHGQSFKCPTDGKTQWNGTTDASGKP